MSWCKRIAKKKKKREQKELLKYRLDTNWSQLLQADGVDGLSHMPEVCLCQCAYVGGWVVCLFVCLFV